MPLRATVAALFLLALGLRLWGIGFGLPHTECRPDETWILSIAADFWSRDLNPRFFQYPSLYLYLVSGAFGVDYAWGRIAGTYDSLQQFLNQMVLNRGHLHLVGRLLTALFGALTVLPLLRLGTALFDRPTALLAGLGLAVTHLHARESHFATTDVPMVFFITWAMALLAALPADAGWPAFARAGLVAGLATSTKYAGGLLVLPAAVAALRSAGPLPRRVAAFTAFTLALVAAFFAATPYAIPEWPRFLSDVLHQSGHLDEGHRGLVVAGWRHHLTVSLWHGLGWPQLVAAGAGAVWLMARDRGKAALILAFPVAYFVLIARGQTAFVRYALPLVPFACLLAAAAVRGLAKQLTSRGAAALLLHALVLLPSAVAVARTDQLLTRTDTRVLATSWVRDHVPAGAAVGQAGSRWARLQLPPSREALDYRYGPEEHPAKRLYKIELNKSGPGFDEWTAGPAGFLRNGRPVEEHPEYVVVARSPLVVYDAVPSWLQEILDRDYEPLGSWEATATGARAALYDQQDAFYLPFAGLGGALRPGPGLTLYRRRNTPPGEISP